VTKLVPPAAVLSATARPRVSFRRHQNIAARRRHGYSEAADRSCLTRLRWSNIWRPGIKLFQCQYCLIFTADTLLSFHKQSPCVYAFPPVQGIVACFRVGGGGFELHKQAWYGFCNSRNDPHREIYFPGTGNFFGTRENRVPLTSLINTTFPVTDKVIYTFIYYYLMGKW